MTTPNYPSAGYILKSRYLIQEEIGRGGFSVVYGALDQKTGQEVAVKLLVPPPAMEQIARERMKREVVTVQAMDDPSIVPIYEFIEEGPWSFIVMEKISGSDLQTRISQRGPLDWSESIRVAGEIARTLSHAHRRGILHRDIKPQNILLEHNQRARLTDFGSARMEGQSTLTHTGGIVGTMDYLAPEILSGARADSRSDIYSLGMTLFFCVTGALPEKPSQHLPPAARAEGHHIREIRKEVPEWVDAVVARATAGDPASRYPTALNFLNALESPAAGKTETLLQPGSRKNACLICGGYEPFGISICSNCKQDRPKAWLFIEKEAHKKEQGSVRKKLGRLLDVSPESKKLGECVAGMRPLACVAKEDADTVREYLRNEKIHTLISERLLPYRFAPPAIYLLLRAVIIFGLATGFLADRLYLWLTPLVCLALYAISYFNLRRPLIRAQKSISKLPAPVHEKVIELMSGIAPGAGRNLMSDLIWMARDMFARLNDPNADWNVFNSVQQLLESSASAAKELSRLDELLNRLEGEHQYPVNLPQEWRTAHSQIEKSRDTLVQRMLEAVGALGALRNEMLFVSSGVVPNLEECLEQIKKEVEIQSRVRAELSNILIPDLPEIKDSAPPQPAQSRPGAAPDRILKEMQDQGIATLQICPACGRCYDHTVSHCEGDGKSLETPRVLPFRILNRYRLTNLIGQGGMGAVFKAQDQTLKRFVAIKIIRAEHLSDLSMRSRLEREAHILAQLNHPAVINLYDYGELPDGSAFLIMELLEGCDLAYVLNTQGPGTPSQVARVLEQAAEALAKAHAFGIIHRDIKPANFFLVPLPSGFQTKVLDFGLAKPIGEHSSLTLSGMLVGTPKYMSPEQIRHHPLDERSDLFSLACVAYELLAGAAAFRDETIPQVLTKILTTEPEPLSKLLPGIAAELDHAFVQAFNKDAQLRPKTVALWVEEVAPLLVKMPSSVAGWRVDNLQAVAPTVDRGSVDTVEYS